MQELSFEGKRPMGRPKTRWFCHVRKGRCWQIFGKIDSRTKEEIGGFLPLTFIKRKICKRRRRNNRRKWRTK
jgi:hypothetical protein